MTSTSDESSRRELVAWAVLVLVVAATYALNVLEPRTPAAKAPAVRAEMRLVGQYVVGVRTILGRLPSDELVEKLLRDLESQAVTPGDRLALVILTAELGSLDHARTRVGTLRAELGPDAPTSADLAILEKLWAETSERPTADELDGLVERYGWFGELATAPPDDRGRVLRPAVATAVALFVVLGLGGMAFLAGCGLLLVALVQGRTRPLLDGYRRIESGLPSVRPASLEATVLFMAALLGLSLVAGWIQSAADSWTAQLLIVLALPVLVWPRVRRVGWSELRRGLGWSRGRGLPIEIGSGLVGYVAGMPILAAGLAMSFLLVQVVESPPYHPIVDWIREAGLGGRLTVYALACVWAPLVEESVFRGHFFHYLRGRMSVAASVLIQALVFAAIHPQGLAGIPVLAALASVLALIREWRGSLVASITVHALHNALAVTLLVVVFS